MVMGVQWRQQMWKNILHSVKTGESAFEAIYRMSFKDCYQQHLEDAKKFRSPMKRALTPSDYSILDSYDFAGSNVRMLGETPGKQRGCAIVSERVWESFASPVLQSYDHSPLELCASVRKSIL